MTEQMRVTLTFLFVALSLCACPKKPEGTAAGTRVIDWKLAQSDRESIRGATTAEVAKKDVPFTAHPTPDSTVVLALHLEVATVTFTEDGKPATHTAAISVSADVTENGGYSFGTPQCAGPHYQLAAPGEAPREMMLMCNVRVKKSDADVLISFTVRGDGKVE